MFIQRNPGTARMKALCLALLTATCLAACDRDGPLERAGEKVDRAIERTGDKIERATDR
jgi:predicted small lipoprotein YifL